MGDQHRRNHRQHHLKHDCAVFSMVHPGGFDHFAGHLLERSHEHINAKHRKQRRKDKAEPIIH